MPCRHLRAWHDCHACSMAVLGHDACPENPSPVYQSLLPGAAVSTLLNKAHNIFASLFIRSWLGLWVYPLPQPRFQHYLEAVLEAADEFHEIPDIIARHAMLEAVQEDLRSQQHAAGEHTEAAKCCPHLTSCRHDSGRALSHAPAGPCLNVPE